MMTNLKTTATPASTAVPASTAPAVTRFKNVTIWWGDTSFNLKETPASLLKARRDILREIEERRPGNPQVFIYGPCGYWSRVNASMEVGDFLHAVNEIAEKIGDRIDLGELPFSFDSIEFEVDWKDIPPREPRARERRR